MKPDTIDAYDAQLAPADRAITAVIRAAIAATLPEAAGRIWHAHPVWFLNDNPVVGYSRLKPCLRLLFWSGRSFATPGLSPEGSFMAAEAGFTEAGQIDPARLAAWLAEARSIQWDYRNIVRRKGRLEPLTPGLTRPE